MPREVVNERTDASKRSRGLSGACCCCCCCSARRAAPWRLQKWCAW